MAFSTMADVPNPIIVDAAGTAGSGYVLKAYLPGTTASTSIFIDSVGSSPQASITANANGVWEVTGNEITPYIDKTHKWGIFANAVDAAANTPFYMGPFDNVAQLLSTSGDSRYGPIFATVAAMVAASPVSIDGTVVTLTAGMSVSTQGYFAAGDGGGVGYFIVASQAADEFGDHTNDNGTVSVLQYIGELHSKWFGAKGDADYAEWVASQTILNSTDENTNIQAMCTRAFADNVAAVIDEGVFLLNPTESIHFKSLPGDSAILKGAGADKTEIFNTVENTEGGLFVSLTIADQAITTAGTSVYEDMTILETHLGDVAGTGGVNALTAAFSEGLVCRNVKVLKAGNRAIAMESPDLVQRVELENVFIKDAWKNGVSINGFDTTGTVKGRVILNNVEVDGYNLIADAVGGLVDENPGVNIVFSAGMDVSVDIATPLKVSNGFAAGFRYLGTGLTGKIIARDIETPDTSSAVKQTAVYIGEQDVPGISLDIDGVTLGGGLICAAGSGQTVTINGFRCRNAALFDLRNKCDFIAHGLDFARPESDDKPCIMQDFIGGSISGSTIIARKPVGDISNNNIRWNSSGYRIDGSIIATTGDGDGGEFWNELELRDLRMSFDVSGMPDQWTAFSPSDTLSTFRTEDGIIIRGEAPNGVGFMQGVVNIDSGLGTYTIKAKLTHTSGTVKVYASHGVVVNDLVLTLTGSTEVTNAGYTFTDDTVTFKIGDTSAFTANAILEYLRITQP